MQYDLGNYQPHSQLNGVFFQIPNENQFSWCMIVFKTIPFYQISIALIAEYLYSQN